MLPLVWDTIPEEFFEKLWKSMPARVAAVLEAKSGYTKYQFLSVYLSIYFVS